MIVTTLGPLLPVVVSVSVMRGGADVTVCPWLFVVVIHTVDLNVVLQNITTTKTLQIAPQKLTLNSYARSHVPRRADRSATARARRCGWR